MLRWLLIGWLVGWLVGRLGGHIAVLNMSVPRMTKEQQGVQAHRWLLGGMLFGVSGLLLIFVLDASGDLDKEGSGEPGV